MSPIQDTKNSTRGKAPHPVGQSEIPGDVPRTSVSSTVAKAIGIVEILATRADVGISLAELSALIEMPKSSTHRYLVTLQELGLAVRKDGDRFCLGVKVIELAGSFLEKSDIRYESQATMNQLAEMTGETIHLAVPSGTEVVYISKIESKHTLGMSSHLGTRLPMYCTSLGKSILAFSKPALLQAVLNEGLAARTPNTITTQEALQAELFTVRGQGFALDHEENEPGICCVGAPILDYSGKALAAISISAPCERMSLERALQLGPLLWESTQQVSRRWGFSGQLPDTKLQNDNR